MDDKERSEIIKKCIEVIGTEDHELTIRMLKKIKEWGVPLPQEVQELTDLIINIDAVIKTLHNPVTNGLVLFSEILQESKPTLDAITAAPDRVKDLALFISEALQESGLSEQYTLIDVIEKGFDEDGNTIQDGPFTEIIKQAEKQLTKIDAQYNTTVEAQKAGRKLRLKAKKGALASGAIMNLQGGNLVNFSNINLFDAFSPNRISKLGTLPRKMINEETGQVMKSILEKGEITPVSALEVSYKALLLLTTINGHSVENFREYFVKDGAIRFYVKGVLDELGIDARPKSDELDREDRKTAGVLYLEKQFIPLVSFVGTIPNGSRYSVLNYEGYDIDTDVMTIRSPYLFQLWQYTQKAYSERKAATRKRIEAGKKPLHKDLTPLQINELLKPAASKEDDSVLEIFYYITNTMLNAGKGKHTTEIYFKTIIKKCSQLRENLKSIEDIPSDATNEDGKKINKTARYNSELRKIARAFDIMTDPNKSDVLKNFSIDSVSPSRAGKEKDSPPVLIPPTKSTLEDKIVIEWRRIKTGESG